jgi:Ribonuclease G/E
VNPEIDQVLKEEEQESIMDMERRIDRPIIIISKEDFHLEQYEVSTDGI